MSSGCIVFTTRNENSSEIIEDGENGFFIDENRIVNNVFLIISIVVNLFLMFSLLMKKSFRFNKAQNSFFLLSYLVLSLYFLFSIPTLSNSYNPLSILFLLVIIWSSDSAGYFFGIKYGKRRCR